MHGRSNCLTSGETFPSPEDQRSLLESALLLVPIDLGLARLDTGADPPPARRTSAPATLAAGALAVLVLGVGLGATWARRPPREAPELSAVTAVREAATASTAEATARLAIAPTSGERPASPAFVAASASAPPPRPEAGVAEEKVLLKAARRARDAGAYDLALVNLAAHERRFPDGALAAERERLRRDVLAATAK
jgi:hypothetical protein